MLKINKRIVSSKKHTVGFVLTGNRRVTRKEAIALARQGKLDGVRVVKGGTGAYLQSTGSRRLDQLPQMSDGKAPARRAKAKVAARS